jgi:hypothetical protein
LWPHQGPKYCMRELVRICLSGEGHYRDVLFCFRKSKVFITPKLRRATHVAESDHNYQVPSTKYHATSMEADGDLGGCIMFAGARVVADKGIDRCRHACQSSLLLNKVQSTQLYYTPKSKDPVLRRGMARTSVSLRLRSVPCEHPRLPHPCLHRLTCHCLAALDHQVQSTRRRDGQLKSHSDVRLSRRSGTITSPCTVTR